ncbi:hypothetical protein GF327_02735 [Candidatus Woesearchaeota archaeon]|nr:hypothetical protein [Candidatus Woesearchaeota archaeon]
MKLKIPFFDILDAFENASYENHYFIDTKNHKIIFISEYETDSEKRYEELNPEEVIGFEERTPDQDYRIMQSFVYKIKDENVSEEFINALNRSKPFRNFRDLLNKYSMLSEKWFEHRNKEITNEAMNWLCDNDIELEDKSFMPKIEIKELEKEKVNFPEGFKNFGGIECMNCKNRKKIKTRYFQLSHDIENRLIDKQIKKIMKDKYGIEKYGHISGGEKEILTSAKCPKCGSEDVFMDFARK